MNVRLPSLDALKYFEVTARHMSFTLAAEELFISQSAVSQKIRLLEEQLGYPLFQRLPRRLILTLKGGRLLPVVRRAIHDIESELNSLAGESETFRIKVQVTPSIATSWLIPRLSDFSRKDSDIDLELDVNIQQPRIADDENFVGIAHYRDETLPEQHELLFPDYVYPVATRELIQKYSLYNISDLKNAPLLHDSVSGGQLSTSWDGWFSKRNLRNLNTENSLSFNQANLIISAAVEGQGVALARHVVAAPLIKEGKLIPLFNDVEEDGGLYLVGSLKGSKKSEIQLFWRWVTKQAKSYQKKYSFSELKMFQAYDKIKPVQMARKKPLK